MKLKTGLAVLLSSLSLFPGCSVEPLTGAPCKGSLPNCPTGQRCAPPGAPADSWGQCEAPALDLSVSSPVDNAQRTPSTLPINIGACPAFSATAVDLKGDWNVSEACMDQGALENINRLLFPGCNVDVLEPSGWMAGGIGFGDTAAIRALAWVMDYQLRVTTRPGTSAACELSECESRVIPADGFSTRCKLSGTGAECACDVWFDTTDALSAIWAYAEPGVVLTPKQGTEERYAVAADGDGLRVRRAVQPGPGAGMQGAFTLKLSRAR